MSTTAADVPPGNATGAQSRTANLHLKGFKNGIKGMMKVGGALTSVRATQQQQQHQTEEEELYVEDLAMMTGTVDKEEDSMNWTDSHSALRTSLHTKKSGGSDSPRGFEEFGAGANIPQEAQASPLGGSDPHLYATSHQNAPLSPAPSSSSGHNSGDNLKHPTSAPVHLQTGQGYSPNNATSAPAATTKLNKHPFLKGKIKISALKNFVGNGLDLSSSSNHGGSGTTRHAAAAAAATTISQSHHTNTTAASTSIGTQVKRTVGFSSDVANTTTEKDTTDKATEKGAGSRIARSMRKSIFGLGILSGGAKKAQPQPLAPMPLESETEAEDEPPQLQPMPADEEEDDNEFGKTPQKVFQEQEKAKQIRREKHSQRVAKWKTNADGLGGDSNHGTGTPNSSDHQGTANDANKPRRLTAKSKERLKEHRKISEHQRKINRSADRKRRKQLLQEASRGNTNPTLKDNHSATGSDHIVRGDRMAVSDRVHGSVRLHGSGSRLANSLSNSQSSSDPRMASSDRVLNYHHSSHGSEHQQRMMTVENTSDHTNVASLPSQDTTEVSSKVSFKPSLLRAPSGEVSAPSTTAGASSRKAKKEQDEKLRERVRNRQSLTMQNMASFSVLDLIDTKDEDDHNEDDHEGEEDDDDDDDESFASDEIDIDEEGMEGSDDTDDGLYIEDDEDGNPGDNKEGVAEDVANNRSSSSLSTREEAALALGQLSLKDIFRVPETSETKAPADVSSSSLHKKTAAVAAVVNNYSSKDSLDMESAQGSFQHVESEKTDAYLQLVIGNNVPTKVPSPTSAEAPAEGTATAVATTAAAATSATVGGDDKRKKKRGSKHREKGTGSGKHKATTDSSKHKATTDSSKHKATTDSSKHKATTDSSKHKEGTSSRKQRLPGTEKSSRRRDKSPRRKSDQTETRRRKHIAARDPNSHASDPVISMSTSTHLVLASEGGAAGTKGMSHSEHPEVGGGKLGDSAKTLMSQAGSDHVVDEDGAMIDASAKSFADEDEPRAAEETNREGAASAAAGVPSSTKEVRRDSGEARKGQSRSGGKEKRISGGERSKSKKSSGAGGEGKSLKSSGHASGDGEKKPRSSQHRGRPSEASSSSNVHGKKSHKSSRGHSEAASRRESRGDRVPSNRRRHSLDAKKRLSAAAAAASSKPDVAAQEQLGKSLAQIKW